MSEPASKTRGSKAAASPVSASVVTSFAHNPLTTTFSRPQDCSGIYRSLFLSGVDFETTCMPDGFKTDAYFSPGLVCPDGYASACHDNTGVASLTTVTCCPTFKDLDITLGCLDTKTLSSVWSTLFCTWIAPESSDRLLPITQVADGVTTTIKEPFHSPGGLNAFGVRMVYQSSDLVSSTQEAQTSSTAKSAPDSSTSPQAPSSSSSSSSGLSTGAKAAIGVVIPLVVIGILAGIFLWWRKRRQRRQVRDSEKPAELAGNSAVPRNEAGAMPPNIVELPGSSTENEVQELSQDSARGYPRFSGIQSHSSPVSHMHSSEDSHGGHATYNSNVSSEELQVPTGFKDRMRNRFALYIFKLAKH